MKVIRRVFFGRFKDCISVIYKGQKLGYTVLTLEQFEIPRDLEHIIKAGWSLSYHPNSRVWTKARKEKDFWKLELEYIQPT